MRSDDISFRQIAYQRYKNFGPYDYPAFADYYRRKLARHLSIQQDWHCLDLACGFGNFLSYLRQVGVRSYVGVDNSVDATNAAKQEFGDQHVAQADVFNYITSTDNRVDFISALDFVEHISKSDLYKFLSLSNARQPIGGLMLIRTPNANGLFGTSARYADITHDICFTPASLGDVLIQCGYSAEAVWEDGPAIGSVKQTVHWIVWQIARFCIRLVNAAEIGSWGDGVLTRNMWVLARKCNEPL
jgi:SAM-dependent methyltransferase